MAHTKLSIRYAAGFVDGEGCIDMHFRRRSSGRHGYSPRLTVGQRTRPVLDLLAERFGGKVKPHPRPKGEVYIWHVYGAEALEVIKELEPFLIVKRDQAQEILKFKMGGQGIMGSGTPFEEAKVIVENLKRMKRPWLETN